MVSDFLKMDEYLVVCLFVMKKIQKYEIKYEILLSINKEEADALICTFQLSLKTL